MNEENKEMNEDFFLKDDLIENHKVEVIDFNEDDILNLLEGKKVLGMKLNKY